MLAAVAFAFVGAASHLGSARFANAITGSSTSGQAPRQPVHGGGSAKLEGFVTTLVSTRGASAGAIVLLLVALVLVVYAAVLVQRGEVGPAAVVIGLATVVWVVRIVAAPDELPPGLLGAWPVVVLAALGWSRRTPGRSAWSGIIALATAGVLATQYDVGGGLNWGARFLAPALPMLAVLLASTLRRIRADHPDGKKVGSGCVRAGGGDHGGVAGGRHRPPHPHRRRHRPGRGRR